MILEPWVLESNDQAAQEALVLPESERERHYLRKASELRARLCSPAARFRRRKISARPSWMGPASWFGSSNSRGMEHVRRTVH